MVNALKRTYQFLRHIESTVKPIFFFFGLNFFAKVWSFPYNICYKKPETHSINLSKFHDIQEELGAKQKKTVHPTKRVCVCVWVWVKQKLLFQRNEFSAFDLAFYLRSNVLFILGILFAFDFWLESSMFADCQTFSHATFRFATFLIYLFAVRKLKSRMFFAMHTHTRAELFDAKIQCSNHTTHRFHWQQTSARAQYSLYSYLLLFFFIFSSVFFFCAFHRMPYLIIWISRRSPFPLPLPFAIDDAVL